MSRNQQLIMGKATLHLHYLWFRPWAEKQLGQNAGPRDFVLR